MPITRSAKKALRQAARRALQNSLKKKAYRNAVKETRSLALAGKVKDSNEWLRKAFKAIDKAAKTNVISKNAAARKKSRLVKFLRTNTLG
jgi:small subunit ribosomal protein S20